MTCTPCLRPSTIPTPRAHLCTSPRPARPRSTPTSSSSNSNNRPPDRASSRPKSASSMDRHPDPPRPRPVSCETHTPRRRDPLRAPSGPRVPAIPTLSGIKGVATLNLVQGALGRMLCFNGNSLVGYQGSAGVHELHLLGGRRLGGGMGGRITLRRRPVVLLCCI